MYDENALLHRKTAKIMANQRYEKGTGDRFSVSSVWDLLADLTVHHPCDLPAKLTNIILPVSSAVRNQIHSTWRWSQHVPSKQWNRLIMPYWVRTQKYNDLTMPIIKTWKLTQVTCVSILKCRHESERKWQVLFLT